MELKEKGINHVIYCDDGIFYSDEPIDFIEEAQSLLDKNGIGAYFSLPKSKWIKKDGEWLSKMKFVGLEYDPFTDELSAATRNGATLKLSVGGWVCKMNGLSIPLRRYIERTWN